MIKGVLDEISWPNDWHSLPLGRLTDRRRDVGRATLAPLSVFLDEGVVPRSSREDNHNRLGADLSQYLVVQPGDLVFNKLRTWQGGIGVSEYSGIVSPAYFVCRPRQDLFPRFAHYALRSTPYLQELTRVSKCMPPAQFDIAWEDLRGVMVRVPPLEEQRAIGDYLDAETAQIAAVVRLRVQQRTRLDEREFALLSDVLGPGERRMTRLRFMASIQSGLTVDAQRDTGTDAVTRPYLRVANVHANELALDSVTEITVPRSLAERCTLRFGDVLMTEGGDLDKLGRGTMWRDELPGALHQNHVFAVRPDPTVLNPEYLALLTRTQHARSYFERTGSKTTGLASTSSEKILGLPVPSLTLNEQRILVDRVNKEIELMHRLGRTLDQQVALLEERRRALIAAAVTGQLKIPRGAA